jgi:hypothetical protein
MKSNKPLDAVLVLHDLHTKLYRNVLAGISNEDAIRRLDTKATHIAWIAGSILYQRYEAANLLNPGKAEKPRSYEFFKDWKGIQDGPYPPLNEYIEDWEKISAVLKNALENITDEKLHSKAPFKMGDKEVSIYDVITFNIHREAYFIGQLGLWRRLLRYDAMKYD